MEVVRNENQKSSGNPGFSSRHGHRYRSTLESYLIHMILTDQ